MAFWVIVHRDHGTPPIDVPHKIKYLENKWLVMRGAIRRIR
jgi:hypothetical protein